MQRVSIEFRIPWAESGAGSLYLPVISLPKGALLDNFRLTDGSESTVTNLSNRETLELAKTALEVLVADACHPDVSRRSSSVQAAQEELLDWISVRGPATERDVEPVIERALQTLGCSMDEEEGRRLYAFVKKLAVSYPVVAVVSRESVVANRILLKYERTMLLSSQPKAPGSTNRFGMLRLSLGMRPREVIIPVDLPITAGSYHLRINGPQDSYVYLQDLRCRHCGRRLKIKWHGSLQPDGNGCFHSSSAIPNADWHFRVARRRGQRFSHAYMRGYGNPSMPLRGLQMCVRYKEVPPGACGTAAVTALATWMVVSIVGYLLSSNGTGAGSDIAALLLALPAVAASWFGLRSDSAGNIMGPSLLARLSLIWSGLNSLTAVCAYLLQGSFKPGDHPSPLPLVPYGWIVWAILGASTVANLVYIAQRCVVRLKRYAHLLAKDFDW